jgi:hypothetical protein
MCHRPGRTWKETSSFAGCRLKKRKRTGEMGISGGDDDEFYMCILLPSGSVGCFKSWVFFRLAGIFLSYENILKQLFNSNTDFLFGETFLRTMKQLFNFIGKHRFNNTR